MACGSAFASLRRPQWRPVRACAGAAALLAANASRAQDSAPAAPTPTPTSALPELGASLLQMLFGLAAVIVILLACLWLLRRVAAPRSGQHLSVLGATAVGPRERVVLVEVGKRVLVLGVAPGRVSRLHDLDRDELPAANPPAAIDDKSSGKGFAGWLQQAMERRNAR